MCKLQLDPVLIKLLQGPEDEIEKVFRSQTKTTDDKVKDATTEIGTEEEDQECTLMPSRAVLDVIASRVKAICETASSSDESQFYGWSSARVLSEIENGSLDSFVSLETEILKIHQLFAQILSLSDKKETVFSPLLETLSVWLAAQHQSAKPEITTMGSSLQSNVWDPVYPQTPSTMNEGSSPTSGAEESPLPSTCGIQIDLQEGCWSNAYITKSDDWKQFITAQTAPPAAGAIDDAALTTPMDCTSTTIQIDKGFVDFALTCTGRFDTYLLAIFSAIVACGRAELEKHKVTFYKPIILGKSEDMINRRAQHGLRVHREATCTYGLTEAKYEWFLTLLASGSIRAVQDTFHDLANEVWHAQFTARSEKHIASAKRLEKLLVALMGHPNDMVRSQATVFVNNFYDGHDWQQEIPLLPIISTVGEDFVLEVTISHSADPSKGETPEQVMVLVRMPSMAKIAAFETYATLPLQWTVKSREKSFGSTKHVWNGVCNLGKYSRCGFYDWRVISVDSEAGSWTPVQLSLTELTNRYSSSYSFLKVEEEEEDLSVQSRNLWPEVRRLQDIKDTLQNRDEGAETSEVYSTMPLQGRFIVQPKCSRQRQIHEISIDYFDAVFSKTGVMEERGSFGKVAAALRKFKEQGIDTLSLTGCLSRDNGAVKWSAEGEPHFERQDASPYAITCRATPCALLGSLAGFRELMKSAQRVGIDIVIDTYSRVSSARAHRKYLPHLLHTLDKEGKRMLLYGSDGRGISFEESCQLNYRHVEAWDLLVEDCYEWQSRNKCSGIRIDDAHLIPMMFHPDDTELSRLDPDGQPHYSPEERLRGAVVSATEEACGFWNSTAASAHWPNPLIVRLCRDLWRTSPNFSVLGDCGLLPEGNEKRIGVLARSGMIPQMRSLPQVLCQVFGKHMQLDGASTYCSSREDLAEELVDYRLRKCNSEAKRAEVWASSAPGAITHTANRDAESNQPASTTDNLRTAPDCGGTEHKGASYLYGGFSFGNFLPGRECTESTKPNEERDIGLLAKLSFHCQGHYSRGGWQRSRRGHDDSEVDLCSRVVDMAPPKPKVCKSELTEVQTQVVKLDPCPSCGVAGAASTLAPRPCHTPLFGFNVKPASPTPRTSKVVVPTACDGCQRRQQTTIVSTRTVECVRSGVERSGTEALATWFEKTHECLPDGAITVQSSVSYSSPLPGLLYERGAWPATDFLFFSSDVPATFGGEIDGSSFRLDVTNIYTTQLESSSHLQPTTITGAKSLIKLESAGAIASPFSRVRSLTKFESVAELASLEEKHTKAVGPEFGFDLRMIPEHYKHRRALRRALSVLSEGAFFPLAAVNHQGDKIPHVLAFCRLNMKDPSQRLLIGAINFGAEPVSDVYVNCRFLSRQFHSQGVSNAAVLECFNAFEEEEELCSALSAISKANLTALKKNVQVLTVAEVLSTSHKLSLLSFGSACLAFRRIVPEAGKESAMSLALALSSLMRLEDLARQAKAERNLRGSLHHTPALVRAIKANYIAVSLVNAVRQEGDISSLADALCTICKAHQWRCEVQELEAQMSKLDLFGLLVDSGVIGSDDVYGDLPTTNKMFAKMERILEATESQVKSLSPTTAQSTTTQSTPARKMTDDVSCGSNALTVLREACARVLNANKLGPLVLATVEVGKWSTVGGLGVMIDELALTMSNELGQETWVLSPYYHRNRRGETDYLKKDNITWAFNITIDVGSEQCVFGVHEGVVKGVKLIFLHNERFFPCTYPNTSPADSVRFLSVIGKAFLEVLCQKRCIPQVIVTNDWATALIPAYAKSPNYFGSTFKHTTFFHILHNFDQTYEGRIYPPARETYSWIHGLPDDLFVDPLWAQTIINPSRCALMSCDSWGTVSVSYRDDLMGASGNSASPLAYLLNRFPRPFATPNGIPIGPRKEKLAALPCKTHEEAKEKVQMKYFGFEKGDPSIPVFAFIGRITRQKGVHLILEAAESIIKRYNYRVQVLIGGMVTWNDPYSAKCGHHMRALRKQYPWSFWADPDEFFVDGTLINLGADFGLMPSLFEPGGIVQQEFFVAGTPVIAYKTGGLKDTVFEFNLEKNTGNGFSFASYTLGDFIFAIERAYRIYQDKAKYGKLRENCTELCISTEACAANWLTEFCRLRGRILVNPKTVQSMKKLLSNQLKVDESTGLRVDSLLASLALERAERMKRLMASAASVVKYVPADDNNRPRSVAVAGSFDQWKNRRPMTWDNALVAFTVTLGLPKGTYNVKFLVDGDWVCTKALPIVNDSQGIPNNVLHVN